MSYSIYSNKTNTIITNFLKNEIQTLHSILSINTEEKVPPTFSMKEFITSGNIAAASQREIVSDNRVNNMISDITSRVPELKQMAKLRKEIEASAHSLIRSNITLTSLRTRANNNTRPIRLQIDRLERDIKRNEDYIKRREHEYNELLRNPIERHDGNNFDYWGLIKKAKWHDNPNVAELNTWCENHLNTCDSSVRSGFSDFIDHHMARLDFDFEAPHGMISLKFHIIMRGKEFYNNVLNDYEICLYLLTSDNNYIACNKSLVKTLRTSNTSGC
jgi:hypothetical protein